MKRKQPEWSMKVGVMQPSTPAEADRAVQATRMLFRRTLASWASDALAVRHAGLHQLTWLAGSGASAWSRAA